MARIQEIFRHLRGGDGAELFSYLNKEVDRQEIVQKAIKELIPDLHDVMSTSIRPDKIIEVKTTSDILDEFGQPKVNVGTQIIPVARAPLGMQKYIIQQKASFASGSGVELKPSVEKSRLFDEVYRNWNDNKINFDLKDIFERCMGETQVAVIFYGDKSEGESLESFRFKHKIISPLLGDTLYPFFDEDNDDMIAFGREYQRGDYSRYDLYAMNEGGSVELHRFINNTPILVDMLDDDGNVIGQANEVISLPYTKLPIIYGEQLYPECWDTRDLIKTFEFQLNDFLTQLGYSGDPILAITADESDKLPDFAAQGKALLLKGAGSKAEFITPDNATESRAMAFSKLEKFIFGLTHSALLDSETMKELSVESGEALKRMLTDIFSEAEDKQRGYLGKFVQRMVNWQVHEWRALLGGIDPELRVNIRFIPKTFSGEKERIDIAQAAAGIATLETRVSMAGLEEDVPKATEQIKQEINGNNSNGEQLP